jgi:hypothetical protein
MEPFEEAQRLLASYQKNGNYNILRHSLDILDELIESKGAESPKANTLKNTILIDINRQVSDIFSKRNIFDFMADINDSDDYNLLSDKFATVINASFSKEDREAFREIVNIKSNYFKQPENQE